MSWLSDFTDGVSDAVTEITRPVSNILKEAQRGDLGRYAGNAIGDITRAGKGVAEIGLRTVTGSFLYDSEGYKKAVAGTVGATGNVLTMGTQRFVAQDNLTQAVLRSDKVSNATLGFSNDYAGYSRGLQSYSDQGSMSSADQNSSLRFISKVGVIGGAGLAYQAYSGSTAAQATAAKYGAYSKDGLTYGAAATQLSKGDVKGAVTTLSGTPLGDAAGEYLPALPALPSWVPDLSDVYDSFINPKGGGTSATPNQYGASNSGSATSSAPMIASATGKTLAVAAVAVAGIYFLKKKRMI